ncbi:bifunctional folylpolyglutamate synthase/dihydrofolate synthase [Pleionea sediminis]|uniref:bifunctional folylpolyglutamate synthase/dihydrofolate synthase n=1 Tax=Pleionea sediminis TaxID=2569479 RepID=UPI0013DE5924|nr:folylpolyglutamate synthase/dihydrofolate synthase family protein [Pleionea sediminis]
MSQPKSLTDWLEFIESIHPSHIELGLDRIKTVATRLKLLSLTTPVITVGGTNGKGSAVAAIEALLTFKGKRVATYTSPHILRFNERLRINGTEQSDDQWVEAFTAIDQTRGDIELTYFEFTTLAALYQIAQAPLDVIVLEVGLGGRLDAVNIIDNVCSIITSIDFDHEDWLGSELTQIAGEKSGIVRPDSTVILGGESVVQLTAEYLPETTRKISSDNIEAHLSWWSHHCERPFAETIFPTSLRCAVLACLELGISISETDVFNAIPNCVLPGRWQTFANFKNVWLDVAHNPQAIANLKNKMSKADHVKHWVGICGLLKDKKAELALRDLADDIEHWCFVDTHGPRGQTAKELMDKLSFVDGRKAQLFNDELSAFSEVWAEKTDSMGILVFGSFHVVANMVEYLGQSSTDGS